MLDPEGRHLLLDALRPPLGYELDLAVGTTYTLDLYALLTAPVAFAMFDRESDDGTPRTDPIAALQALRQYASRITLFCQAGDIAVPRDYRSLIVYLEDSIVPVIAPHRDATAEGRPLTSLEQLERRLDIARRILGRLRFTATCRQLEADAFEIELSGTPHDDAALDSVSLDGLAATIRPVTLGHGAAIGIDLTPSGMTARYRLSYASITPFFAIHVRPTDEDTALDTTFLVNAELVGAPDDRAENVMVGLLKNRADLIRFLLLLLGNVDDALAAMATDGPTSWDGGGSWATGPASEALLEPLMRAYSRDRTRLHEIQHVMEELAKTETGHDILPDGWDAVWAPIQAALERESRR